MENDRAREGAFNYLISLCYVVVVAHIGGIIALVRISSYDTLTPIFFMSTLCILVIKF